MFCRAHEILCRVHEIISRANEILCHAHDIIFQLSIGGSRGRLIGVTSPSPFNLKNVINQVKSRSKEKKKERNRSINYIHVGVLFLCLSSPPPTFFPWIHACCDNEMHIDHVVQRTDVDSVYHDKTDLLKRIICVLLLLQMCYRLF